MVRCGRILDGRDRYAACQLAGIEPTFATYDGDDPDGYALAVNLARRNMNKGQTAVVIAGGHEYKNYTQDHARSFGVSKQYVSWARLVCKYDDLRRRVLADTMKLAEATTASGSTAPSSPPVPRNGPASGHRGYRRGR